MVTLTSHSSFMLNILVQIRRPNLQSDLAGSRYMRAYLIAWTINDTELHLLNTNYTALGFSTFGSYVVLLLRTP
jgi:hypothetical protein